MIDEHSNSLPVRGQSTLRCTNYKRCSAMQYFVKYTNTFPLTMGNACNIRSNMNSARASSWPRRPAGYVGGALIYPDRNGLLSCCRHVRIAEWPAAWCTTHQNPHAERCACQMNSLFQSESHWFSERQVTTDIHDDVERQNLTLDETVCYTHPLA